MLAHILSMKKCAGSDPLEDSRFLLLFKLLEACQYYIMGIGIGFLKYNS